MFKKKRKSYFEEENLTEEQKLDKNIKQKGKLIKQIKKDIIIKTVSFASVIFIVFTFIFGVTFAPTNDMFPAIHEGDLLIYYRLGSIANKDIALYETSDGLNVGRIQATVGETIDKTDGGMLSINGNIQPIQERSGLYYKTYIKEDGKLELPSEIPPNSYLILGDERDYAKDSRDYGLIQKDNIKGNVFTIIRRRPL